MKKAIQNNLYMLRFMWKYCKSNVILRLLSTLTAPVQPFIFIITMKLAIDGISEKRDLKYLLTIILTAFLVGAVSAIFNSWVNSSSSAKAQPKISKGIQDELLKKSLTLDFACYDDAEYYDKYVRAMQEAESRAIEVLDSLVEILSSIVALLMIVSLIIALNPIVILICVAVTWDKYIFERKKK
jgi:ATP-binding cassette subfamily B protein